MFVGEEVGWGTWGSFPGHSAGGKEASDLHRALPVTWFEGLVVTLCGYHIGEA